MRTAFRSRMARRVWHVAVRTNGYGMAALSLAAMIGALVWTPARAADTNSPAGGLGSGTNGIAPRASLSGYVPDDKYKLRVGDKVSLQIMEDRDPPKPLVIADSEELDVPYIGRVPAAGKTCKELAEEVKAQLEKEYYYRATVVIALDVANKFIGKVYVWGQVKRQGAIDLVANENLTAGKAILKADGFGDFANKKNVKVIRSGGSDGKSKQTFELNMLEILDQGKTEKDVLLQPDDSIIVGKRLWNM